MVAIFSGNGLGYQRGSSSVLGGSGTLGSAAFGRGGDNVYVNAATGNLVVDRKDEFLVGRGPDTLYAQTYNSMAAPAYSWAQSINRVLADFTGATNAAGSTVTRGDGDGHGTVYTYDAARGAYLSNEGGGSYDEIRFSGGVWTWTDGNSRTVETYTALAGAPGYQFLATLADADGNLQSYTWNANGTLQRITSANGDYSEFTLANGLPTQITTYYSTGAGTAALTRTRYVWDSLRRLTSVTVDLSPNDNSVADGKSYTNSYTYQGTTTRIASITQTDGSSLTITYDSLGRVATLTELASAGVSRTTTLGYGANYTNVTDANGQVTRLDYAAAANFATPVDAWASSNVTKETATIGGSAATNFTVQSTAWSAISQGVAVAAGDTVTFGVTMQAVGTVTSQSLGLYSDIDGWGAAGISSARIVSGPGQLVEAVGGLWTVTGLSTTQGTRIEVTRTYTTAQNAGAYLYFDHPGGYRAGTSLTLADISLMKSATAAPVSLLDLNNWYSAGVTRTAAGTIDGAAAYKYAVQAAGGWSAVYAGMAAKKGDSYSLSLSLQASDGYTSQSFGLYGDGDGWGSASGSTARIVSGPGTLSQAAGGLWTISGLSATQVTRVEIIRNYEQDESGGAYIYADLPGNFRAGASMTIAAAYLTKRMVEPAAARQLVKITAPPAYAGAPAQTVQFGYNDKGDLISVTDGAGSAATYAYDSSGNLISETDRLGNVITRTYGSKNELLTETRYGSNAGSADAALTTRYAYDAENHLRFIIGAEGNGTEYRYTASGEIEYQIEYPEHFYDVSAMAPTAPLSEATLNAALAGIADKSSIKITYNSYDVRGQLVSTTRYGIATTAGGVSTAKGYSRTNYVYDQAGRLLSRSNEGENAETFVYDGLGRLVGTTDINAGTTSIVFNDAATQTVVTMANGMVKTSTYNKVGDLVSYTESGSYVAGGTTANKYDRLGRLRMSTDPTGFNKYYLYDKAGRLIADVLHNGSITEYRYDANGRMIGKLSYTNLLSAATLTTLADPNSTVEMAAIRPAFTASDVCTWSVYDAKGRVIGTIDSGGGVQAYAYDRSDRLVKTTRYANLLTAAQILAFKTTPPATVVLPAADAARDSVARNFYDKEGRLIGVLDGEGYLSRTIYDRAGQKTEQVSYLNPTNSAYRASGTLNDLVATLTPHSDDRRTRYVYDGQGQLRYEVDGLNQVIEYVYDTAGRVTQTTAYAGSIAATTDYTQDNIESLVASSGLGASAATRRNWAAYDTAGRVAYSINADDGVTRYTYDNRGQVTKSVQFAVRRATTGLPTLATMDSWAAGQNGNSANRVVRNFYSARDELRFSVDAEGFVTRTDFDAAGRVTREVRWDNAVAITDSATIDTVNAAATGTWADTRYGYDFGGELTDVWNGENNQVHYSYYGNRRIATKSIVESVQSWTTYNYDGAGRVVEQLVASGAPEVARTAYTYDGLGNVTSVTDPNNNVTTRTFDRLGRMLSATDPLGKTVSYQYDAFGEAVKATDARGYSTYSYYDRLGRLTTTRDAEDYVTEKSYDVFGNTLTVTRRYNRANNAASVGVLPTVTAHAGDATTSFLYDKLGRLTRTTDALGNYEQYTLDAYGNRISVRNKLGGIVTNSFDRRGKLLSETLPMASTDAFGTVTASSVTNRFQYDARGNLTKKIEAYGLAEQRTTTFVYDKADRPIEKRGDAVSVLSQSGFASTSSVVPTEQSKYDQRGRVIETVDALGLRTLFYYNKLDQKTAELRTGGTAGTGTLSTFVYDKNGNVLASRVYGTAVAVPATAGGTAPAAPAGEYRETTYTYDKLNRLLTSSVANLRTGAWNGTAYATGVGTVTTTNAYDSSGNLIKTTDANGGITYFYYDKAGRKIASIDPEAYLTFLTLDAEGNVTQEERLVTKVTSPSTTSNPSVLHVVLGGDQADRITQFAYDKNGRRISETRLNVAVGYVGVLGGLTTGVASSALQYAYNGLGQVTQKTYANGDYVSYSYDATGRLLQESRTPFVDQTSTQVRPTTFYSYDGLNNLTMSRQGGLTPAAGDRITRYSYGAGGRLAWTRDATGAQFDYYYDATGNIVRENWTRYKADGSSVLDGILYNRDLQGRLTSQALATWNGSAWVKGDSQDSAYNAYGEVAQRGLNGLWQQQFAYDGAGRLYRTNSGDGVWRYFLYDGNGNQTATIESEGANLANLTIDQALAAATANGAYTLGGGYVDGVNTTINAYDKRGLAIQTRQSKRQLNATAAAADLVTSRTYNAFGESASETDARGFTTDFTYNTMGRVTRKQSPLVNYTAEDGSVASARPTENYYYDIAGRTAAFQDANGNVMTRLLLAGTGHEGSEALVTYEYHADGGYIRNAYDMFGDKRIAWDEIGRRTDMAYDAMGRVTQLTKPNGLIDYFGYDALGQKISHWNNVYQTPVYGPPEQVWVEDPPYWDPYYGYIYPGTGHYETHYPIVGYAPEKESTDYDLQGRVTRQVTFGGDTTTTSYVWNSAIATNGMGTFGGWTETTTQANGRTSTRQTDLFGREVYKSDLGGHVTTTNYDAAGRATQRIGGETLNYDYLNTGLAGKVYTLTYTDAQNWASKWTAYGYDASGNIVSEKFVDEGHSHSEYYDPYYGYQYSDYGWSNVYKNATATYDGANRLVSWAEAGSAQMPAASIAYEYDLASNIRRSNAQYRSLDANGTPSAYVSTQDNWYRFDAMNRVVTKGSMSGGQIVRGYGGVDYQYNAAGERIRSTRTVQGQAYIYNPYYYDPYYGNQYMMAYYDADTREDYTYDAGGTLSAVRVAQSGYVDNYDGTLTVTAPPATGALRASYTYDSMGRLTHQVDWLGDGTNAAYDRTVTLNGKGQVTSETVINKQGADTIKTVSSHDLGSGAGYALGAIVSTYTSTYKNNVYQNASTTTNSYAWYDGAVQSSIVYKPNTSQSTTYTTTFYYDTSGQLTSIYVSDGRPRSVTFINDVNGQAIKRDESDNKYNLGDPHEIWYRFGGRQLGYTGNNGTVETDYATSIGNRTLTPGTGAYRFGQSYGSAYADFDLSGEAITSFGQGSVAGGYTARAGDTLQSVAAQLWGDSSLWYKLAEANGMGAANALTEGQRLTIPAGVLKSEHNAATLKPYDPSEALGDVSPTTPKPTSAKSSKNKCGLFGAVLLVVIAVAVTVVTAGAAAAALSPAISGLAAGIGAVAAGTTGLSAGVLIGIGAASSALGSIASQGFGVATGIQDKFSWKGVAMAAIGGGVGAGLGASSLFSRIGSNVLRSAASGAASSALTQGIGVVAGLQDKFDWAGVAVAGVSAGVSSAVGDKLGGLNKYAAQFISGGAGAIAGAAARSLMTGTSFGDNLLAALPDVIGSTIGNMLADAIESATTPEVPEPELEPEPEPAPDPVDPETDDLMRDVEATLYPQLASIGEIQLTPNEVQDQIRHLRPFVTPDEWDAANAAYRAAGGSNHLDAGMAAALTSMQGSLTARHLDTGLLAQIEIDWAFIRSVEGFRTTGYVPKVGRSTVPDANSGVTIGTGFDLGQKSLAELRRMGMPQALITRLTPYLGLKGAVAQAALTRAAAAHNALVLTDREATTLDALMRGRKAQSVAQTYNAHSDVDFQDLAPAYQTAIASVHFQYGHFTVRHVFANQVTHQNWEGAIRTLRNWGSFLPRRRQEANLMERTLRPPN